MRDILTLILAGGKGERLNPLTRDRAKPAVPFGGIYRIIDFTLSNCLNSGLRRIFVLIQYKSFSLQKHILTGWNIFSSQLGEFIDVIPAQQRVGSDWYKGTADAIYQNISFIEDHDPKWVLILSGDHIYKMNYQKLIDFHKKKNADMTVACVPMPKEQSQYLGVIEVDEENRVIGFREKPKKPKTIPGDSTKIYASMGIYLFNKDILIKEMETDARMRSSKHDFGINLLPQMLFNNCKVYLYNFVNKNNEAQYWRDIGTRDAYYEANMDLVKVDPEFNLYDKSWPVRTYHEQYPPIKAMSCHSSRGVQSGSIIDSIISGGCVISGGHLKRSVLSSNVRINKEAHITDSVIMEGVVEKEYARIKNAIIDKQVIIPPHSKIGYNPDVDKKHFDITSSGIVIVAKKASISMSLK